MLCCAVIDMEITYVWHCAYVFWNGTAFLFFFIDSHAIDMVQCKKYEEKNRKFLARTFKINSSRNFVAQILISLMRLNYFKNGCKFALKHHPNAKVNGRE